MNPNIAAQASQAAQQGQELLSNYRNQAATAQGQYNTFTDQATQANKQLQAQTAYMQGEGSATNLYNTKQKSLEQETGFNPMQLQDANKTLFGLTGALTSAANQFSTPGGVGAYGMSAPALASYQGSILQPLQAGVSNANTQVGVLNTQLQNILTGAGQYAATGIQGEQAVVDSLNKAVVNYQNQAAGALQNMQFYSDLAQKQGGLNAQQAQNYAAAQQAYASAQQAIAQAGLLIAQTKAANLANQQTQNVMNAPKPAAPTPNGAITLQGGGTGNTIRLQGGGGSGNSIALQGSGGNLQGGNTVKLQGGR